MHPLIAPCWGVHDRLVPAMTRPWLRSSCNTRLTCLCLPRLHAHAPLLLQECTGNKRIQNYTSRGINCWSGNDDEAHDARHESGAVGVISVTSNIIPGLMAQLMKTQSSELNASLQVGTGRQQQAAGTGQGMMCMAGIRVLQHQTQFRATHSHLNCGANASAEAASKTIST
jgi:hypothetical protein